MRMKNLLQIALIVMTIASCSCHEVFISEEDLQNDIFYYRESLTPFSGTCISKFNGINQVKAKRSYQNGIMNGEITVYYKNGQISKRGQYKDGEYHGKWIGWFKNGTKSFEVNHDEGLLDGAYITYHENGKMKEKGIYNESQKTGKWEYFDNAGNLICEKMY